MFTDADETHHDEDALLACGEELVTGEVIHRDGAGRLLCVASHIDGVPSGPKRSWYPDGTRRAMGNVRWGIAVGEWYRWHPNGRPARYTLFGEEGEFIRRQEWDKQGNLTKDKSSPQ